MHSISEVETLSGCDTVGTLPPYGGGVDWRYHLATVNTLVSIHVVDELGVKATMPIWLSGADTQTLAQLVTAAQSIATDTDAIIGGQIIKVTAAVSVPVPSGAKALPAAGSRVEQTALFNFSQTGSPYKYGVDVPSVKDAALTGGRVNLANTDVLAWITLITGAIGAFTPESTAFRAIVGLVDALLTFRKHRKQLDRVSYEPS